MAIRRFTTTDNREGTQFSNGSVVTCDPSGYLHGAISLDAFLSDDPGVGVTWIDPEPAPAAELTDAQRLAEQVIRVRARTHDGNASAAVAAKGLPRDQFRAQLDEVRDLIERATVTVAWAQDAEQAGGDQ